MAHVVSIFYVWIVLYYDYVLLFVGCWFGVADEKLGVYFPDINESALAEVDACDSDGALSQALTELLYTKVGWALAVLQSLGEWYLKTGCKEASCYKM